MAATAYGVGKNANLATQVGGHAPGAILILYDRCLTSSPARSPTSGIERSTGSPCSSASGSRNPSHDSACLRIGGGDQVPSTIALSGQ
jgi:hypothetical protein